MHCSLRHRYRIRVRACAHHTYSAILNTSIFVHFSHPHNLTLSAFSGLGEYSKTNNVYKNHYVDVFLSMKVVLKPP